MKSEDVIRIIKCFATQDRENGVRLTKIMAANESAAGRYRIGKDLERAVAQAGTFMLLPGKHTEGIQWVQPTRTMDSIVLPPGVRDAVSLVLQERKHADALIEHGIKPSKCVLLSGESGVGKTALAEAVATAIELPFGMAQYASLIGSHVGETGKNLSRIFSSIANQPCVLFLDECDTLLSARRYGEAANTENCRMVNEMLLQIDAMPSTSLVIMATNMASAIDTALSRRVKHIRIEHTAREKHALWHDILAKKWPQIVLPPDLDEMSPAMIEQCAEDQMKAIIVGGKA